MISALIVDDYPATLACVRRALMEMFSPEKTSDPDCIAITASNARDAISILGAIKFDLVVSDYDLGDTCGTQILEYLRRSQPDLVEHFVFFTGCPEKAQEHHHKIISKEDAGRFAEILRTLVKDQPIGGSARKSR